MQNDDELVEKVVRAFMKGMNYPESPDAPCSKMMPDGSWKVMGPLWKVEFAPGARAAIQVMREAGWKGPDPLQVALAELADAQRPLDPEAAAAIYSNTEALYET